MSRMVRIRIWFKGKYRCLQKEYESGSSEHVVVFAYSIGVFGIVAFPGL
jgi:hypothetical protein